MIKRRGPSVEPCRPPIIVCNQKASQVLFFGVDLKGNFLLVLENTMYTISVVNLLLNHGLSVQMP